MKANNFVSILILATTGLLTACRPLPKDPPLAYDHNRLDAKVGELKIEAANPLSKLGVPDLWKKTTGKFSDGNRVRVAVVGTGIDYTIADLRDALAVNLGELSEKTRSNGIDDDNNGYADDVVGYDFFSGDGFPYDWNGHDTFTASVIAATARMNSAVVGVAPNAELVVARYIGPDGRGKGLDAAEALTYSIQNQAKIIYFNWPEGGFNSTETPVILQVLAQTTEKNILVVMPAGNSGNHAVPLFVRQAALLPNVVVVAGLNPDGQILAISNSGRGLAMTAAPAVGAVGYSAGGEVSSGIPTTSVAAAYVTGAAALIATLPQMGSAQKIRAALLGATDKKRGAGEALDVLSTAPLYLGGL